MEDLVAYADGWNVDSSLLKSVLDINDSQPAQVLRLLEQRLGSLQSKRVAVLGLAFNEGTDDVRESRSVPLVSMLLAAGAKVVAHDPLAMEHFRQAELPGVEYAATAVECIRGSDAVVVMTAAEEFASLRETDFVTLMATPIVVDARRLYDHEDFRCISYSAVGLGKPAVLDADSPQSGTRSQIEEVHSG